MADTVITATFKNGDTVYIFDSYGKFISTTVRIIKVADAITGDDDVDVSYELAATDVDGVYLIRQQLVTFSDAAAAIAYLEDI